MPATTESHRIYWQQWISKNSSTSDEPRLSRRELITSSAAVRLSPAAKACDVTKLLRKTMQLSDEYSNEDALVIVGTLYSLPRGYVQFSKGVVAEENGSLYPNIDPFHVVRTLTLDESPLKAKETMQRLLDEQLARAIAQSTEPQRSIIAPKSQFYFIPSPNLRNIQVLVPNCVELDGYATDMETRPTQDDWIVDTPVKLYNDPSDFEIVSSLAMKYPWLAEAENISQGCNTDLAQRIREQDILSAELKSSRRLRSGYLLKRSQRDPNLWRQVQCVLTPTDIWYVSRRYHDQTPYHGRIRLTRALLLQPSSDYPPLMKTPYAWEVVSNDNRSHLFRASCKQLQQEWMDAISEGIVNSYEASLFENAESWVTDEAKARNRRAVSLVVDPLCQSGSVDLSNPRVTSVLRWGLDVTDYRETCKYFNSFQETQDIAYQRQLWEMAERIWFKGCKLVQKQNDRPHSHADTLCQHIDFMITGQRRKSADASYPTPLKDPNKQGSFPPVDLFDPLLNELQSLASHSTKSC